MRIYVCNVRFSFEAIKLFFPECMFGGFVWLKHTRTLIPLLRATLISEVVFNIVIFDSNKTFIMPMRIRSLLYCMFRKLEHLRFDFPSWLQRTKHHAVLSLLKVVCRDKAVNVHVSELGQTTGFVTELALTRPNILVASLFPHRRSLTTQA